ncbi:DUF2589 domain-containing protein [Pseudoalteromonas phenolica]|uniref:DUF2589 domain-containing protein n=1 Tax=Pseudoalteromonas phenolica TaxID=161398 RepID=A0A0S2JZK3_9GAMM|nr:DUF2589 domain-containing protein [Pseudoalteromonas phenolica]ALO41642.1 hypothetical protein PP2015_1126 [Pseudoalteromonas phenolica]MBE0353808.1 hypothetical protein [Pseudoalteromonas phenolica O-BC30]RXE91763.1 DUF2589 domain-containing protein [Pseudoalteromonas phenolica O-BC30]
MATSQDSSRVKISDADPILNQLIGALYQAQQMTEVDKYHALLNRLNINSKEELEAKTLRISMPVYNDDKTLSHTLIEAPLLSLFPLSFLQIEHIQLDVDLYIEHANETKPNLTFKSKSGLFSKNQSCRLSVNLDRETGLTSHLLLDNQ